MRFGLSLPMQYPEGDDLGHRLAEMLEMVRLARQAGFQLWIGELEGQTASERRGTDQGLQHQRAERLRHEPDLHDQVGPPRGSSATGRRV